MINPVDLESKIAEIRKKGLTIATLNGSFDLLHAGHLTTIFEASQVADVLIVADKIELGEAHDLELRFHPEHQEAERIGNAFIMRGEHSVLRLDTLTPENVEIIAEKHDLVDRRYNKEQMLAVKLRTRQRVWRNAVALTWSGKDVEPKEVAFHGDGDTWTFGISGRKIMLDWSTGKATFE